MPKTSTTIQNPTGPDAVLDAFRAADRFLVTSHVSPDGDAVGSVLGLMFLLRGMGKKHITCALSDAPQHAHQWLPGIPEIVKPEAAQGPFDVFVIVDAHLRERTGRVATLVSESLKAIVVDHHLVKNSDGQVCYIDPSFAAAGEMVYSLFERAQVPVSRDAAECLYVAIITDTGGFRFSNTNPRSHRIAAALMETGIDHAEIASRIFDSISKARYELLRRVLERTVLGEGGRLAHVSLTRKDMQEADGSDEDIEGLINYLRNLTGVDLAIMFREADDGKVKVSFRGRPPINCATILQHFGGGGHAAAAGATLPGPIEEARASILDYVTSHVRSL